MKQYTFKKLDAFATDKSTGNPAGMIQLESPEEISAHQMQQIATELSGYVNEVGYVWQTAKDRFSLRYFSAEKEVMFCGHATIAIMYDLICHSPQLAGLQRITIDTRQSALVVENHFHEANAVFISAPPAVFHTRTIPAIDIAHALGISEIRLGPTLPVIINAGLDTLIVQITDLPTTLEIKPEFSGLKKFCEKMELDIITIFTNETTLTENSYRSRVFGPRFGYLEDPATGSGNAALGNFLLQQGLWDGTLITIEQNNSADAPNSIRLRATVNGDQEQRLVFGGGAIERIRGIYLLHED